MAVIIPPMEELILVVEDEPSLLETLLYNLEKNGYQVISASDGYRALELARTKAPDLIIMDLMIPGIDGMELTRILRAEMKVPLLMLTARTDEIDRVLGLEMGADDYITKPFSMRELMARVKAALRRVRLYQEEAKAGASKSDRLVFGNLTIDQDRREATINDQALVMKPKEYELLLFFANHRGRALSRDFLLERVWGWDYAGGTRTVDVHVRWLREKIEVDASQPERIITVRGVGYRFEG